MAPVGLLGKGRTRNFSLVCNLLQKLLRGQLELVLFLQLNEHRDTVRQVTQGI